MPKGLPVSDQKKWLLSTIRTAVAAANDAEQNATTAQAELVSRSKQVGMLLLEAKKLHPAVKDFEAFLMRVGRKLSRAYDLLRLAGGRTTDEELKKDARERQQKSRAKKLPKPDSVTEPMSRKPSAPASLPETQPEPSVTSTPATESAEPLSPKGENWDSWVNDIQRLIAFLPYERAHDLLLWLTDHLIAIRPEHGAATQKKAA
jgi:hypothetical protein